MMGLPYMIRLVVPTLGLCTPKVPVGGMDVAGWVEAVGRHVTRFRPAMRSLTGATGPTPSGPEAGPADCVFILVATAIEPAGPGRVAG